MFTADGTVYFSALGIGDPLYGALGRAGDRPRPESTICVFCNLHLYAGLPSLLLSP